jgi:hypothetical protein
MKTKCPHCRFDFDTDEKLIPPFKIGQKIELIQCHKNEVNYTGAFPKIGRISNYKLLRDNYTKNKKFQGKEYWLYTVEYVPHGNRNGCSSIDVPHYILRSKKI